MISITSPVLTPNSSAISDDILAICLPTSDLLASSTLSFISTMFSPLQNVKDISTYNIITILYKMFILYTMHLGICRGIIYNFDAAGNPSISSPVAIPILIADTTSNLACSNSVVSAFITE